MSCAVNCSKRNYHVRFSASPEKMSDTTKKPSVVTSGNRGELVDNLSNYLQTLLDKNKSKEKISIGVSGGSLTGVLADVFPNLKVDWRKVVFLLCDERKVPFNHPESTYGTYLAKVVGKVEHLSEAKWLTIEPFLPVADCASDYEAKLKSIFPVDTDWPPFDLLLLGIGPDGHTASLFPGHPEVSRKDGRWVGWLNDSPKPPSERVTLTLSAINSARHVVFVATGAEKAPVVKEILENPDSPIPSALVKLESGGLWWFLDSLSAAQLANKGLTTYPLAESGNWFAISLLCNFNLGNSHIETVPIKVICMWATFYSWKKIFANGFDLVEVVVTTFESLWVSSRNYSSLFTSTWYIFQGCVGQAFGWL